MVTQLGREDFARRAVADFHLQRYGEKELIVIVEETILGLEAIPGLVTIKKVPQPRPSLGELRNQSVELARGDLVAIWDDDDRSHPLRLQAQVDHLMSVEADACFLKRIRFQCKCGATVTTSERHWECTMLARREAMPAYPPVSRNEDNAVAIHLIEKRPEKVTMLDAPHLYTRRFHGGNTWGAQHVAQFFRKADPPHVCDDLTAL